MHQLPITHEEVRAKLNNVLTDISLEMIDADKEKMRFLHHLGIEAEEISDKLKACTKLRAPLSNILFSLSNTLDDIFTRLVIEEALDRMQRVNRRMI